MSRQLQNPVRRSRHTYSTSLVQPSACLWPPPDRAGAAAYKSTVSYSATSRSPACAACPRSRASSTGHGDNLLLGRLHSRVFSAAALPAMAPDAAALEAAETLMHAASDVPAGAVQLEAFVFSSRGAKEFEKRCIAAQQCLAGRLAHEARTCLSNGLPGLQAASTLLPVVKRSMEWSTATQDTCSSRGVQSLVRASALVTAAAGAPELLPPLCARAAQALTGTPRLRRTAAAVHILQANVAFEALKVVLAASEQHVLALPVLQSALSGLNSSPIKRTVQGVDTPPDAQLMALFEANLALPPLTQLVPALVQAHAALEEAFLHTWAPIGAQQLAATKAHSGAYLGWHAQACTAARAADQQAPPPLHLLLKGWLPPQGGGRGASAPPSQHRDPLLQAALGFAIEPLTAKHAVRSIQHLLLRDTPLVRVLDAATALAPLGELPPTLGRALLATAASRGDAKSLARTLALYMHDDSIWQGAPAAPDAGVPWAAPASDWVRLALQRPRETSPVLGVQAVGVEAQDNDVVDDAELSGDSSESEEEREEQLQPSTLVRVVRLLRHARHGMAHGDMSADALIAQLCTVCIEAGHGDQLPGWARPPSSHTPARSATRSSVSVVAPLTYLDSTNDKARAVLHGLQQALVAASQELQHSPVCDTSSASFHWGHAPPQEVLPPPLEGVNGEPWTDDGSWQGVPMGNARAAGAAVQLLVSHLAASFDTSMPPLEAVVRDPAALVAYDEALHSMTQQADRLTAAALSPLTLSRPSEALVGATQTAPPQADGAGAGGGVDAAIAAIAADAVAAHTTGEVFDERRMSEHLAASALEAVHHGVLGLEWRMHGEVPEAAAATAAATHTPGVQLGAQHGSIGDPDVLPDFSQLHIDPQALRPRMSFSGHSRARLEAALGQGRRGVQKPTRVWLQAFLRGLGLQRQLALQETADVERAALRGLARVEPSASQAATVLRAVREALGMPPALQEAPIAEAPVQHAAPATAQRVLLDVTTAAAAPPPLASKPPRRAVADEADTPVRRAQQSTPSATDARTMGKRMLPSAAPPRVPPRVAVARVRQALKAAAAAATPSSDEAGPAVLDTHAQGILQRSSMFVRRPWHSFVTPQQLAAPADGRLADAASSCVAPPPSLLAAQQAWARESARQYLAELQLDEQGVRALVLAAQLACLPSAPPPDMRSAPRRRVGKPQRGRPTKRQ